MENYFNNSKSGFKRTINWNKHESSTKTFAQNRYLSHLVNPRFQGVNRLFVLSFENENGNTAMFFTIEEAKKNCFGLFTRNHKSFVNVKCSLIFVSIK